MGAVLVSAYAHAESVTEDTQPAQVSLNGTSPMLTVNGAETAQISGASSSSAQFSPAILFFASQYVAPRWGSNSTSMALNSQVEQSVVLPSTNVTPVPLPAAALLLLSGIGGLAGITRRRRAKTFQTI